MYDMLKELIKPELLVLIPVLYLIGAGLKKSAIQDKWIPALLGVCGIGLSIAYLVATTETVGISGVLMCVFTGVTQGVLISGASVYLHQLVKQSTK